MSDERRITNLTDAQADGRACVACHRNLLTAPASAAFIPVGRSITGSQVFACASPRPCAGKYAAVTS